MSGYNIKELVQEAQFRWLRPAEVLFILQNYEETQLNHEPPQKPPSGSLFLFNKRVLRFFRKDGHNWRRKKDGKNVGEAHNRLKVANLNALECYYAHGEENPNFQRRSYRMLEWEMEHIVLVHYRDITIGAHEELLDREHKTKNYLVAFEVARGQAPSIGDMAMDNVSQPSQSTHSYSRDQSAPNWNALNKQDSSRMMIDSDNVRAFVWGEFGSQNSIHEWNSSHEVGGMVSGQPPSISDMIRGNMSSGGTSYSRDPSAPSWNALYKRDSSPMMIDSDSVQQFVGSEFGRNDFSEVSSTSLLQGKGW